MNQTKYQAEEAAAFHVACSFWDWQEDRIKRAGKREGMLTGNEDHYVNGWREELGEMGAHEADHVYHDQWKAMRSKAGRKRIAGKVVSWAKDAMRISGKQKWPKVYQSYLEDQVGTYANFGAVTSPV